MVCDDNADIAVLELRDDVLDVLHGDGVHAGEGFVQEDELRVHGEGAGNLAAAPLAAGELDALGLADLGEVELVDELLQAGFPLGLGHLGHLHDGHDVVLHGHLPEDGSLLREISHALLGALVHGEAGQLVVVDENAAFVRDDLAGDHVETGGLSGAVRAQEANDLTLVHFHGNALHDRPDAVFFHEVLCA